MNQLLPLEMEDSSILETSLISLRDDFEATGVASMAATLTSHGSQHDSAELMQILGIRTQIDTTPRRSSLRKKTQAVPSVSIFDFLIIFMKTIFCFLTNLSYWDTQHAEWNLDKIKKIFNATYAG